MSALGGKRTLVGRESRMIFDHPHRRLLVKRESLEIVRGHFSQAKMGIGGKAEADIISRISEDHATSSALLSETGEAGSDERATDAQSLALGRHRHWAEAEPSIAPPVNRHG